MIFKSLQRTFSANFGLSKVGKTVTVTVLDTAGNVLGSGYTPGSVVELGHGNYGITITFTSNFTGFLKWNNTTDGITLYEPVLIIPDYRDDISAIRKIETNNWKIESNQLVIYDDDGVTALYTFNLKKEGAANGDEPDERTRV